MNVSGNVSCQVIEKWCVKELSYSGSFWNSNAHSVNDSNIRLRISVNPFQSCIVRILLTCPTINTTSISTAD